MVFKGFFLENTHTTCLSPSNIPSANIKTARTTVSEIADIKFNKSTLDNSPPPLLNLKSLLRPQGQIIDVECEK